MGEGNPPPEAVCYAAGRCVRRCREALCPEDRLVESGVSLDTDSLLDWFRGLCDRKPEMALLADLLRAEGRREVAGELLPDLERYLDNLGFELRERRARTDSPRGGYRPVLVVDNTTGKEQAARAPAGGKRNRVAPRRPAGDAA